MLHQAMTAYAYENIEPARLVVNRDSEVDEL